MNKKRDHLSIMKDILIFISEKKGGAKPTHILYKSNLSYQMLTQYIAELISKGLIKEKSDSEAEGKRTYELTNKGMNFLKDYGVIKKFMESYGFDE